jgi:hypothetical protein
MTSLHVGTNEIPEKEMRELMAIAMSMNNMKILCEVPFKDKTITELDLSGKNLGIEGARVVAEYLDGNGALLSLDISDNGIGGYYTADYEGQELRFQTFTATPAGNFTVLYQSIKLWFCRPCCYR